MNFYKRGLIFATFLGCCLSLSFLAASLSTDRWVIARVQRSTNPSESDGHVFFGLFTGRRELNVGYGWRTYSLSVIEQIRKEPELLHLGLWVSTLSCVCGTIVFAFIGALMAVVNTATSPIESMTGRVGLFVWNTLAPAMYLSRRIVTTTGVRRDKPVSATRFGSWSEQRSATSRIWCCWPWSKRMSVASTSNLHIPKRPTDQSSSTDRTSLLAA